MEITEEALEKLREYHWPGNIRELAHSIERAVILSKNRKLIPVDFLLKIRPSVAINIEEPIIRVEDYEKKAVNKAMLKHNGNLSRAAEELGIARSTLYRKISRFGTEN